jgi:membrane-associated phospholipid phosphatase
MRGNRPIWIDSAIARCHRFDRTGMRGVARARRRWLTTLLVPYTIAGTVGLPWLLAGAAVDRVRSVAVAIVAAALAAELIKRVARRARPDHLPLLVRHQRTGSFPSGHAATAAAAACALFIAAPHLAAVWIAMAALMAASRVYVGVHWPTDVLAGAGLGLLVGALPVIVVAVS